jgi:hypothetical protein
MTRMIEAIAYPANKKGPSMGQKFKRWVKQNPDAIVVGGIFTLIIGLTVWAVIADAKAIHLEELEYEEYMKNLGEWIRHENSLGKSVYQLMDGSYIAVDAADSGFRTATDVVTMAASAA